MNYTNTYIICLIVIGFTLGCSYRIALSLISSVLDELHEWHLHLSTMHRIEKKGVPVIKCTYDVFAIEFMHTQWYSNEELIAYNGILNKSTDSAIIGSLIKISGMGLIIKSPYQYKKVQKYLSEYFLHVSFSNI